MANGDQPSLAELDEVLERAVDRQVAEQRALRQALDQLRDAVRALGEGTPAQVELDVGALDDRMRRAIEGGIARLESELRDVRSALGPQIELTSNVNQVVRSFREELQTLHDGISSVETDVAGVGADIEGIAQALIDLNAGLRSWADDVDASVTSLRDTVDSIRELTQTRAVAEAAEQAPVSDADSDARIERMETQVKETAELSLYLTDQIEDLDRVLKNLGELPERIEGVVSQAMRRTLTARAKLEQDATSLVDELTESLEAGTDRLSEVLDSLDASGVRKLTLGNVELTSQVASLHDTLIARLAAAELDHRQTMEALARAIDRWAKGKDPRALETMAKATTPRKRASVPSSKTSPAKGAAKGSAPARGKRRSSDATE